MRCGRSTGCSGGAVCATANDEKQGSSPAGAGAASKEARIVLTPAVSSQRADQSSRSRPDVSSRAARKSANSVLAHSWRRK